MVVISERFFLVFCEEKSRPSGHKKADPRLSWNGVGCLFGYALFVRGKRSSDHTNAEVFGWGERPSPRRPTMFGSWGMAG
ncbi:MAG: hypothetical protein ACPGYL_01490, partial [Rhodospirillaceae bacterium]